MGSTTEPVRLAPGQAGAGRRSLAYARELHRRAAQGEDGRSDLRDHGEHRAGLLDSGDGSGVGYLLKDRVGQVEEFVEALHKVADGGTVIDPEVVRQLLRPRRDPLEQLTPREREVPALVAEGRSNGAIAKELVVSEAAIGKHIGSMLTKLDLPPTDKTHRRVLAVLTYLRA
ncbi:LuxR C-terminal-related transcriptional regulator [Streptomyces sp. NBC_00659]